MNSNKLITLPVAIIISSIVIGLIYYNTQLQRNESVKQELSEGQSFNLQSKCKDSVDEFVQKYRSENPSHRVWENYISRWNSDENKCFVLYSYDWSIELHGAIVQRFNKILKDVLENKTYAQLVLDVNTYGGPILNCALFYDGDINNKEECESKEEFDDFVNSLIY